MHPDNWESPLSGSLFYWLLMKTADPPLLQQKSQKMWE